MNNTNNTKYNLNNPFLTFINFFLISIIHSPTSSPLSSPHNSPCKKLKISHIPFQQNNNDNDNKNNNNEIPNFCIIKYKQSKKNIKKLNLQQPLVRSKSFSPNKEEEQVKKEPHRKLARSFSEIPSVKLIEDQNGELQMAMCRICEEPIHSSLLEDHSKICAMANEEDMKAMNVEDHLRAVAKILLTRSNDIPQEKRKMITELREIALFAVENGIKENLKMIHIMNDIIKNFDPKDENRELAIKIQSLISDKVNALKRADEVINSSPRIFRTNSPRILKSPREEELSQTPLGGRSRSDSDPVHQTQIEYKPKGVPTISDFEFIKPITKGGYGKVFLAKKIRTGDIYAIKRLKKSDMIKKNQLDHVKVERNILAYTSNPFVVKMYYSFQTKDYYYLVMEYLQGGDCFSLLQMLGSMDENMAKMIIAETVLALEYLHSHGIIHRDVKPDNLLIDKKGHIKLTDFGLSKVGLLDRQTVVPPSYFSPTLSGKNNPTNSNSSNGGSNISSNNTTVNNNNTTGITMVGGHVINTDPNSNNTSMPAKKEKKLLTLAQSKSLFSASSSPSIPSLNLLNSDKPLSPMMMGVKGFIPPTIQPISSNQANTTSPSTTTTTTTATANQQQPQQTTPPLPPHNMHRKLSCVGTPDYLAPEILLGIGHGASADWFSLGVILYEFLCGISPFNGSSVQETFQNILQRNISWPEDMSPEAKDLIDKLLALDPRQRLGFNGAEEIKSHPFFKSINWKTILTQEPYFKPKIENLQDTSYFDPRKEIYKVSDDFGESCKPFIQNQNNKDSVLTTSSPPSTSSTSATATTNLDSITINQNTNANFDDFLYVNFQSLLELNKNYLAEAKPFISNHRRRNST
ncbi:hypothetical protein ACTA71_004686 [Dictyostelium dimigraforme]